jgi:hypothetical protein
VRWVESQVLAPADRTAQSASISFETWRSLAGGVKIVVLPTILDLLG